MKKILTTLIAFALVSIGLWGALNARWTHDTTAFEETTAAVSPPPVQTADRVEVIRIEDGTTYADLMTAAGVSYAEAMAVHAAALNDYDLANLRASRDIQLTFNKDTDRLKELYYQTGADNELRVVKNETGGWQARYAPIPYEVRVATYHGTVSESLYQSALSAGIDERAIVQMAEAFEYMIDFALMPRAGDTFSFVIEERFLNDTYVMPGKLLAGRYVNEGKAYELFYFEESADNQAYFDADGRTAQTMFLKAPVAYKYISSGFTTGLRYVKKFNTSTGHRAIDYAATHGTPIRATGSGTITLAAWNGAYGNMVTVRHNSTYSTNYAHMSKMAVKRGADVKQGDIIGYVGSTGFSTGPHVHYEMVKDGVKINPLLEITPPGDPVKPENMPRFTAERERLRQLLQN